PAALVGIALVVRLPARAPDLEHEAPLVDVEIVDFCAGRIATHVLDERSAENNLWHGTHKHMFDEVHVTTDDIPASSHCDLKDIFHDNFVTCDEKRVAKNALHVTRQDIQPEE